VIDRSGGKRITAGSRVGEKIFCLSAHHFYYSDPSVEWWETQKAITLSKNITTFFGEFFPNNELDYIKMEQVIYELLATGAKLDYNISKELINLKSKNKRIQELLSVDHPDDRRLFVFVVRLLLYSRNYDLYEKYGELIK
jgi:hypothetical protein